MSEERVDVWPLTSVDLLDAAVWREIGSWCARKLRRWML